MQNLFFPQEEDFRRWMQESLREELATAVSQLKQEPRPEDEPLLSRRQIAEILDISLVTLTDWMKKGFPYLRQEGRVYFLKSEVMQYMRHKKKRSPIIHSKNNKQMPKEERKGYPED
ncbi:helix-turn-helix domain-containing protein [Chitinophaga sp. GbtcB8]|uniref:helix-turn-helix domain-containing protein n=1 Tax=Chitinophaga sp. GbtcB8 TaxID=2824753 RepID=UPI001C310498|nr:helix-turn-helix domain-containing protein [Chitinophaga sp. GbtcB8]